MSFFDKNWNLKKYLDLGYHASIIEEAYNRIKSNYSDDLMFDTMSIVQQEKINQDDSTVVQNLSRQVLFIKKMQQSIGPSMNIEEDPEINKAIYESLQSAKNQNLMIETTNPLDRKRKEGVPVGLKNIGNSRIS